MLQLIPIVSCPSWARHTEFFFFLEPYKYFLSREFAVTVLYCPQCSTWCAYVSEQNIEPSLHLSSTYTLFEVEIFSSHLKTAIYRQPW